ncbi:hypothetical protein [Streptomyces triculaminicus]|uniref:hypothetical protein n=1 Tax=Streptomyces triculaminicus TaxID=2816232 RepID=UPI0037AE7280
MSDLNKNVPTATVYDVFADTASDLSAHYICLHRSATDEQERERLWRKVMELRDAKLAVPAYDRSLLITHIHTWRAELEALKASEHD